MKSALRDTLPVACGLACLLTIVTGSRVTAESGVAPGTTHAVAVSMALCAATALILGLVFAACRPPRALGVILFALPLAAGFCMAGTHGLGEVSAALIGVGTGCGYIVWGPLLALFPRERVVAAVAVSSGLWSLTGAAVTLIEDYTARMPVLGAFLVVSLACYALCGKAGSLERADAPGAGTPGAREGATSLRAVVPAIWRGTLLVSVLGFSSGIMRVLSATGFAVPATLSVLRCASSVVAIGVFVALYARGGKTVSNSSVSLAVLLLTASTFMLLPALDFAYQVYLAAFVDVTYLFSGMMLNMACALAAEGERRRACAACGFGQGVSIAFVTLGYVVSSRASTAADAAGQSLWVLAMLVVYLVVIILVVLNMPSRRRASVEEAVAGDGGTPLLMVSSVSEHQVRTNERLTGDYRLSEREMDILILTLTGRNAASIADALCLSKNTVATYQKRLYKKLDVHSKEELRDLVERVAGEGR